MASKDLVFRFLGVDAGAGAEFDRMAGKASRTSGELTKLSLGVVAAGATIAVESVRMAAKFQSSMELIHTQAGASQAEVNKLSKAVLALAGPVATAPDTLSEGLYHLESSGLRGAKAMQALRTAAEGAKIGNANLEDVTNALNAVLASGIKGAQNMSGAMGALNATVGAGDMRMQDLAEAMGTGVLAAVKGFGLSLNDVGAALATFGDNNIRGADAATQLRMAVLFMAKPAAGAKKALGDIGLSTTQLAKDMGKGGLGLALSDLHTHLVKAGDTGSKMGQVLLDAFGHKAGTGLSILEQQFSRFQSKQEEVHAGSKNFASDWTAYTKTFGYSWDRARAAFESMTIQIGTKLLPVATKAMNWIGTTGVKDLDKFSGWVSRNKTPIEDVAKAIGAIAAVKFASGKLNDLSRLFGGGKGGAGGLLGTAASMEKPVPVFVTNQGGVPGVGGGVPPVAAELATVSMFAASVSLTGATITDKLGPPTQKLPGGGHVASDAPNYLKALLPLFFEVGKNAPKGTMPKDLGKNAKNAVDFIHTYGTPAQMKMVQALAKQYPAIAADLKGINAQESTLNKFLVTNTGLAKVNAAAAAVDAAVIARSHGRSVAQVIAQLKKVPLAYKTLAADAKAQGMTIGEYLNQGLAAGITASQIDAVQAAQLSIDKVMAVYKNRPQIASPSKVTTYYGKMIAKGLEVGIKGGTGAVETAAQNLVDKVTAKLDALRSSRSEMAGGIYGNLLGGASLSNIPALSNTGGGSVGIITSFLTNYRNREKQFVRNLGIARKKGLSLAEVTDIAGMGLDQGGPIAAALAGATKTQLRGINSLESQIAGTARHFGNSIAGANYDHQIAKLAKLQHETNSALAIIKELLRRKTKLDPTTIAQLAHTLAKLHITLDLKEYDRKTGLAIMAG